MTLHVRVSRLDDYAGELTQSLEKLESEKARGVLNREEQEDFLGDLRKAVARRDLRPLRNRVVADILGAVLTALLALFLPRVLALPHALVPALLLLCVLALGLATWRTVLYFRRYRHDQRWLHHLEASLARGRTIFD